MKKVLSFVLALCIMVSSAVSASAATQDFSDVKPGRWSYAAVNNARAKGYVNGVGNNRFDPRGTLTIAQLSQVLYNMAGRPRYLLGYEDCDYIAQGKKFTNSSAEAQEWAAWVDSREPNRYGKKWEPIVVDLSSPNFAGDAFEAGYGWNNGVNHLKALTGREWYAKAYVWAVGLRLVRMEYAPGDKATRANVVRGLSGLDEALNGSRKVKELVEDEWGTDRLVKYGYTGGEPDWEALMSAAEANIDADWEAVDMLQILRYYLSVGYCELVDGRVYRVSWGYPDYSYLREEYGDIQNCADIGTCYPDIDWAVKNHIIAGNGTYSADGRKNLNLGDNVTREEFAQFLYNYDRYAA